MRQQHFQRFLGRLRRAYPGRPIWLLLDTTSCHTTPRTQPQAKAPDIVLIWLSKQWPRLYGVGQIWKDMRANLPANSQYRSVAQHASFAEGWILSLSKTEALRKASILAENFRLKSFVQ